METGTYKGGTILPMSQHFKTLHTVEICEKAYQFCCEKANRMNITNINFYLGDSLETLPKIITTLSGPAVYFLDGHITPNSTGFTGKGIKDIPLLEELQSINDLDSNASMIVIDDVRLLKSNISEE